MRTFLTRLRALTKTPNKHELTALDKLPRDVLDDVSLYLGVALVPADGKYDVIRKIEGAISAKFIGAITPTSLAHESEVGQTTVSMAAVAGRETPCTTRQGVTACSLYGEGG